MLLSQKAQFISISAALLLESSIKRVLLFSDFYSEKHLNQYIATSLHHFTNSNVGLEQIEHKFLEPGHTNMKVDSIHSGMETEKKYVSVAIPREWQNVLILCQICL